MNRIEFLNKINTYSARFVLEVEGFNSANKYDINIHSESFLIPVLNETFSLKLENLNVTQKKNFPAVDLADFENRVAFQVTATSDFSKIEDTLVKFFNYNLHQKFDVLYIYIITHKRGKYNESKLAKLIPNGFLFNINEHVIDKDILLKKINDISSTPKLRAIAKLYEHEFSDVKTELRQKEYVGGYLNYEPESISPNLLPIKFPEKLYKAELDIDDEKILEELNAYLVSINKIPIKKIKPAKLVKRALRKYNCKASDWLLFENSIYTFKNLNDSKEPLSKIVDQGTVTSFECKDFYESNEDYKSVFKHLLRNTFIEFCKIKEIEWFEENGIFRFANNQIVPREKRVKWKGKNESTKTVIFEMHNKKEGHIICFRSLAFRSSFMNISDEWYLVLNPTWSFTNPGGYHTSRFESAYMSGLKRLENNNSVFNYFRFFGYYFSHVNLFTIDYPYLKVFKHTELSISPRLQENTWRPVKASATKSDVPLIDLKDDNELFDNSLF
jgi:hypothetical protein